MKLRSVRVHNYRAIIDEEFHFHDYTLLVGANNSGKSTVIDAIRVFYEKDGFKYQHDTDFPYVETSDDESWVEVTFVLDDEEYESLADQYKLPGNQLRLRKFLKTNRKMSGNKSAAGFIFGYKNDGSISEEPFYGAKNVQSGKIGDIIYIPAISKVDDHAKLTGPSALRDLLNDILKDVISTGTAYEQFSAAVDTFAQTIRGQQTDDNRSLAGLEAELNTLLERWMVEFQLRFTPPSLTEIIKSMTTWEVVDKEHGKSQDIGLYGSGLQRYFIYCLIQIGAQYVGKRQHTRTKEFSPDLNILLFEEPEAFLHPPQQVDLARNLRELAKRRNWQVICATHSAHFVSRNVDELRAVIRVRRTQGRVEKFQISDSDWLRIIDANQAINAIASRYPRLAKMLRDDDYRPEMEAVKYFIWLNPDRASAFFADHVLMVEGPSEVALISRMIADGRIKGVRSGLYVMDCMGKYNLHRFMNLFSCLGIRHSVLYDDDYDRNEHKEINELIENSRDSRFTVGIERIQGSLERLLGIPLPGPDHRKPQHVLFLYETGQISEDKLMKFADIVEKCLKGAEAVQRSEGIRVSSF